MSLLALVRERETGSGGKRRVPGRSYKVICNGCGNTIDGTWYPDDPNRDNPRIEYRVCENCQALRRKALKTQAQAQLAPAAAPAPAIPSESMSPQTAGGFAVLLGLGITYLFWDDLVPYLWALGCSALGVGTLWALQGKFGWRRALLIVSLPALLMTLFVRSKFEARAEARLREVEAKAALSAQAERAREEALAAQAAAPAAQEPPPSIEHVKPKRAKRRQR